MQGPHSANGPDRRVYDGGTGPPITDFIQTYLKTTNADIATNGISACYDGTMAV